MALHGDLNDIGLEEIIELIGNRSGVLSLGPVEGKTLIVQVAAGLVASFSVQQRIEGKERIIKLARWISSHHCPFSFEQGPVYSTQAQHMKVLELLPHRWKAEQETAQADGLLSDPSTVFMLIKAKKVTLPLELQRFLDRTAAMLERGASAHDIARRTQMPLEDVQLALHGLKQARKAWPAFVAAPPPSRSSRSSWFSWLSRPRATRLAGG